MKRYKAVVWHGECASMYYVVDTYAPDDEQPCVLTTFDDFEKARTSVRSLNSGLFGV